jgi:hypothetical protein
MVLVFCHVEGLYFSSQSTQQERGTNIPVIPYPGFYIQGPI